MGPGPMAAVLWEGNLDTDALGRGHVTMMQRFIRMTSSRRTLGEAREGPSLGASGEPPCWPPDREDRRLGHVVCGALAQWP